MNDPADHPPIIDPLNAAHVGRQMRHDPRPLLVLGVFATVIILVALFGWH